MLGAGGAIMMVLSSPAKYDVKANVFNSSHCSVNDPTATSTWKKDKCYEFTAKQHMYARAKCEGGKKNVSLTLCSSPSCKETCENPVVVESGICWLGGNNATMLECTETSSKNNLIGIILL